MRELYWLLRARGWARELLEYPYNSAPYRFCRVELQKRLVRANGGGAMMVVAADGNVTWHGSPRRRDEIPDRHPFWQ